MLDELATLYKAFANPTRLRILHLIVNREELCGCEVETVLGVSQSTASRHLVTLRRAGLIVGRRQGTWVHYRLAPDLPSETLTLLRDLKITLAKDPQALADLKMATHQMGGACQTTEVPS